MKGVCVCVERCGDMVGSCVLHMCTRCAIQFSFAVWLYTSCFCNSAHTPTHFTILFPHVPPPPYPTPHPLPSSFTQQAELEVVQAGSKAEAALAKSTLEDAQARMRAAEEALQQVQSNAAEDASRATSLQTAVAEANSRVAEAEAKVKEVCVLLWCVYCGVCIVVCVLWCVWYTMVVVY